jgi:class 3 adenylate cyclase
MHSSGTLFRFGFRKPARMPRIPIFRLGLAKEQVSPPRLARYTPRVILEGLSAGIDNLRHDVYLSPKFVEQMRVQMTRLVAHHGNVEGLLASDSPLATGKKAHSAYRASGVAAARQGPPVPDIKTLLTELQVAGLNRAKREGNLSLDLLVRLAVVKFLRAELVSQFAQVLERCRIMLKGYEGVRQQTALQFREKVAAFQVAKKAILRRAGQELFQSLQEIEKETLARMRRSLFGETPGADYRIFINRLIFTDDGRDDHINADHYVMLGNWERDPDRFPQMREIACTFLKALNLGPDADDLSVIDGWLSSPENAQELVGGGSPDVSTPEGRAQEGRLAVWRDLLQDAKVMEHVIASYEVVPLLSEYSPRINPQQLKNGLVARDECSRVETLIKDNSRLSTANFLAAVDRVSNCRGPERDKVAGRFLRDFLRYHRDLRRLETLNSALDSINLLGNEKLRELSAVNGTLYEFLLHEEQRPTEEKVIHHVILKADIRDSTRLTRSLMERDLNPASYFSLNFFDPVYKLLPKYGASKVFLEGDAMILAILERDGEPGLAVSRACVLAREILDIVRGYNHLLQRAGLPTLELGIGISFQDAAPLYLMDGEQRIMISDALNESDRLSSCNKRARKTVEPLDSLFNVFAFQTVSDADAGGNADDFIMSYNLNGIRISEAAFRKLGREISLGTAEIDLPSVWVNDRSKLHSGLVPVDNEIFRKIVVRESQIPQIDPRDSALRRWTERSYYEVCSNPAIYQMLEQQNTTGA